jgi:hypothetical protein
VAFIFFLESVCLTDGGADPGKPCVFPFALKGINFSQCPWQHTLFIDVCATEVDSSGEMVNGKWGRCGPGCPVMSTAAFKEEFRKQDECKNKANHVVTQELLGSQLNLTLTPLYFLECVSVRFYLSSF